MDIVSKREETIYRFENEGKIAYKMGLSKKLQDGLYDNGYIPVRFPKNIELQNKTKILIKQAWLDFFKVDKKTIPVIFINKFEMASEADAIKQVQEKPYNETYESQEDDYPFY